MLTLCTTHVCSLIRTKRRDEFPPTEAGSLLLLAREPEEDI